MKKIKNSAEAFIVKLQALYDIEKQLEKALPEMARAARDEELKSGFMAHLDETKNHCARLEDIFEMIDEKPKKVTCEGIRGIIEDGRWVIDAQAPQPLADSMLASAARYAEHYEIAGYLSAIEEADQLGIEEAVRLLSQTLAEEQAADQKLASIAKKTLHAAQATELEE